MFNFIEEYLQNPSLAIAKAKDAADRKLASIHVDEDEIYAQCPYLTEPSKPNICI